MHTKYGVREQRAQSRTDGRHLSRQRSPERGETPNPTKAGMYVKLGVFYNIVISNQQVRNETKRLADAMEKQNEMIKRIHKLE